MMKPAPARLHSSVEIMTLTF